MNKVNRRSALKIGVAAASAALVKPSLAQAPNALAGKDESPWPGVVVRTYSQGPSMIPGFKTVSMREPSDDERYGLSYHRGRTSARARRQALYGQ